MQRPARPRTKETAKAAGTTGKKAMPKKAATSAKKAAPAKASAQMGVRKECLKNSPLCKVTFRLPSEAAAGASSVAVVGSFNGWSAETHPMQRLRDGSFKAMVKLEKGSEYHYRFLIDGSRWENDWAAERYAANPFGGDDSVVVI